MSTTGGVPIGGGRGAVVLAEGKDGPLERGRQMPFRGQGSGKIRVVEVKSGGWLWSI